MCVFHLERDPHVVNESWDAFDSETANQVALWRAYLGLWRLEVISTRCAWQLWPTPTTRLAHVQALAEREKCDATLAALEGFRRAETEPLDYQPS